MMMMMLVIITDENTSGLSSIEILTNETISD